jgi:hypothetical protein
MTGRTAVAPTAGRGPPTTPTLLDKGEDAAVFTVGSAPITGRGEALIAGREVAIAGGAGVAAAGASPSTMRMRNLDALA